MCVQYSYPFSCDDDLIFFITQGSLDFTEDLFRHVRYSHFDQLVFIQIRTRLNAILLIDENSIILKLNICLHEVYNDPDKT